MDSRLKKLIEAGLNEHQLVIQAFCNEQQLTRIQAAAAIIIAAFKRGRRVFFLGNGGSAADAQHLAAELVGRFKQERAGLPAMALTTDTSLLTALGNDYGFEAVFSRQVEALVQPGDVVWGISTSGNSVNVIRALESAKRKEATTIGMTGQTGGRMDEICDICLKVPSLVTARIQEGHILIGHILCEVIDEVFTNEKVD